MTISIGGFVNRILDKFLPDIVGDLVGGALDTWMGNVAGAAHNFADALMDVVGFLGGEEVAAKGMEVLEGLDVGQHIEDALGAKNPSSGTEVQVGGGSYLQEGVPLSMGAPSMSVRGDEDVDREGYLS